MYSNGSRLFSQPSLRILKNVHVQRSTATILDIFFFSLIENRKRHYNCCVDVCSYRYGTHGYWHSTRIRTSTRMAYRCISLAQHRVKLLRSLPHRTLLSRQKEKRKKKTVIPTCGKAASVCNMFNIILRVCFQYRCTRQLSVSNRFPRSIYFTFIFLC